MRKLATTVLIMALFIITAQPAEAQRQGQGQGQAETGLQSVDDGTAFHPETLDPANGTILGTFAPITPPAPAGAEGRVIVNYLKTQGVARVNVNVKGLEPGTTYEVLMIDHQPGAAGEIFSLTDFEVDEDGNGSTNVVWYDPFPFNAVNVRLPRTERSARLSTIGAADGIQQQVPSNRGGNRGGGGR